VVLTSLNNSLDCFWRKRVNCACVTWQATQCDPIWQI